MTMHPRPSLLASLLASLLVTALVTALIALSMGSASAQGTNGPAHAIAMHGAPKYGPDFKNFDYVNPDAPKGATLVRDATGTFDTLNPFIIKGAPAVGLGLIYDTLTVSSADEPFTQYCLLCETIEVPDDRSWVEFTLRDDARWHDGEPITVDDVIFSFNVLVEKGAPFYRSYYANIASVEKTGERGVRFTFSDSTNMELPLIMGQLTILPKHYWETRDFTVTTLDPPLGSGAYRIASLEPGRSITYERVEDYWAKDHPTEVGMNNFGVIRYEYFRDREVAREAFKGGDIDLWIENQSKAWATAFDVPPVKDGLIKMENIPHQRVAGMQGFAFNIRRPIFADRKVREALGLAYDFETANRQLFFGAYTRNDSYFDNSDLSSRGLLADAGEEERAILEQYRGQLPEEVYTSVFTPPSTGGAPEGLRENLRKASEILDAAGWPLKDGVRVNAATGTQLAFEIMLVSPAFERIALPYTQNLERLGVKASVRVVDAAQYQNRIDQFDYDMIVSNWGQSLSPGNEQRDYWGSKAADEPGSRNTVGIKSDVIDQLIELVVQAPDRESLVQRVRALDRALLWGYYVVPQWHIAYDRIAYWNKLSRPEMTPIRGAQIMAWWVDPEKATTLAQRLAAAEAARVAEAAKAAEATETPATPAATETPAATREEPATPATAGNAAAPAPTAPKEAAEKSAVSSGLYALVAALALVAIVVIVLAVRRKRPHASA